MLPLESSQAICDTRISFNQQISTQINEKGWAVIDDYLPTRTIQALKEESQQLCKDNAFKPAGINNGVIDYKQRMDQISWLNPESCYPIQSEVMQMFERLRYHLNRENYLGLSDLELHASIYPRHGYFKKHFDNFHSSSKRVLTVILYLNQQWIPSDEGHLRIYLKNDMSMDLAPTGGRLVAFLSNTFEHEVLPTNAERFSLTGWFRRSVFSV